jgi:succinate dehydrogenase hydrophobic anchor subunit
MLRVATKPSVRAVVAARGAASRKLNSTKSAGPQFVEADSGALATRAHHVMITSLAVATPIYFMVPDSYTDGIVNKAFGVLLSANVAAHSWIGMNYVCTDYVPKVSKSLVGPSRLFNVGLAAITFLGLARISVSSKGGIKGCIKGLWNPPEKK